MTTQSYEFKVGDYVRYKQTTDPAESHWKNFVFRLESVEHGTARNIHGGRRVAGFGGVCRGGIWGLGDWEIEPVKLTKSGKISINV